MSILRPGDDEIHYSDGSHRWIPAEGWTDDAWRARVKAHQDEHRRNLGAEPAPPHRRRHL